MFTIKCPDCNAEYDISLEACPHCGCPTKYALEEKAKLEGIPVEPSEMDTATDTAEESTSNEEQKPNYYLWIGLIVAFVAILCISMFSIRSCQSPDTYTDSIAVDTIDSLMVDTVVVNPYIEMDSISIYEKWEIECEYDEIPEWYEGNYCKCEIKFPNTEKHPELARALMAWVSKECLGKECRESDLLNVRKLFGNIANHDSGDNYQYNVELRKVYENDNVVTFEWNSRYEPMLAAHGSSGKNGVTLCKDNGKILDNNMFKGMASLRPLIIKGLKKYFEVSTDEDLLNNLQIGDETPLSKLPFPKSAPWVTEDGIVFMYRVGEISYYGGGENIPVATIPVSQLHSVLTPEARELLE